MFTGLVEGTVPVRAARPRAGGGLRLVLAAGDLGRDLAPGASLAVNGVCLTVAAREEAGGLAFDVVPETLRRTNLGRLRPGARVNVERPLRVGAPLGGHWVQGHVDGVGEIRSRTRQGDEVRLVVRPPAELTRYLVPKGSVCVEGVSLTVAELAGPDFACALIPETLRRTTLGELPPGSPVNLEMDILAKYAERLLLAWRGRL